MIEQVDPRSISRDKPCKKFSGKLIPKGVDLSRTPWSFWDNFTLRIDSHNVIWLSVPQNTPTVCAVEVAIAVLTSDKTYSLQETVRVNPLIGKAYSMPIHYVWDMIRLALPLGKARSNECLHRSLCKHIEAFLKSPFTSFTPEKVDFLKGKNKDQIRSYKKARQHRLSSNGKSKALKSFREERKKLEKTYKR